MYLSIYLFIYFSECFFIYFCFIYFVFVFLTFRGTVVRQVSNATVNIIVIARGPPHYENMPIQIYRKFHLQNLKIFR